MKKWLTLALVFSPLLARLEWGGGQSAYLWEVESEVLQKLLRQPLAVAHPLILLPLLGQMLLLASLWASRWQGLLRYAGLVGLGSLMALLLFIAALRLDGAMLASLLPFWGSAVLLWLGGREKET